MASWMVHLRIADEILKRMEGLDETAFVIGNIAPDSGVPNEDWSKYFPPKNVSHFKTRLDDELFFDVDEFKKQYFSDEKIKGYDNFIRLIQIVDSPSYHPGFDIDSFEADGTEDHCYIEVKTTISKKKIQMYGFHMSPNEWRVASTIKEHYCVYRLMLSEQDKK